MRDVSRRLLVCFAFGTWCFLNVWADLTTNNAPYYLRFSPARLIAPTLILQALVAVVVFVAWELCRRMPLARSRLAAQSFVAVCGVPLLIAANAALLWLPSHLRMMLTTWLRLAEWGVLIVGIWGFLFRPRMTATWLRQLLLWSWPVLLVVYANATYRALSYPPSAYADRPLEARFPGSPGRVRVVWIIFDELSQAVAFTYRPRDLPLPEFDRLKAESVCAEAARSPAGMTLLSMPSLISGRTVAGAVPDGTADLRLRLVNSRNQVSWRALSNVFDDARALGFNTALVGWYHPYGRVLNCSLTECYWTAQTDRPPPAPLTLPAAVLDEIALQTRRFMNLLPGRDAGRPLKEQWCQRFVYQLDRARRIAADGGIGLALIHLQVPHPPGIYDRSRRAITADRGHGYVDNVALADRALGVLLDAIHKAGLDDRTAILVSADHGWRRQGWHDEGQVGPGDDRFPQTDTTGVPFLLHFPGQTCSLDDRHPFNTVVTRQIIADILAGRLTTPQALIRILDTAPGNGTS